MASQGWLCRRVRCGYRNLPRSRKCVNCDAPKPKKRVPAHKQALRDYTYFDYLALNGKVHHVYEECAVCGAMQSCDNPNRKFDRDHDHKTGQPRGLTCVACNILMLPNLTAEKARLIAAYLTRVEEFYAPEEEAA